jgi:hypothetical protein
MRNQKFIKIEDSFIVDQDYRDAFTKLGLNSIDDVFSFSAGETISKKNLAAYRSRIKFETNSPKQVLYLKRYDTPPVLLQLKNWFAQRAAKSCGRTDFETSLEIDRLGINTPKVIAFGEQKGLLFEKRSFFIAENIPDADAIERKLPLCFYELQINKSEKKKFIEDAAAFIKKFHETGFRHRDLYFSHIFYDGTGRFFLIDLSRVFRPLFLKQYYLVKDIAQLFYSAPAKSFSNTDRLRFYFAYTGRRSLTGKDKRFIMKVIKKVSRIARHDKKHNR